MDEVLKRKLFNTPKYEHKSTGIASGLEYRPGYKVGGRVGYQTGGNELPDFNPKLTLQAGRQKFIPGQEEDDPIRIYKKPRRGESGLPGMGPQDIIPLDPIIEDDPFKDVVPGFIPELDPWAQGEDPKTRGLPLTKQEPDPDADPKDQVDFMIKSNKMRDKTYAELDALRLAKREEYDAELKALRERQSQDKNRLALLNMVSAANDPNLQVGQSRVAAAAGALTDAARDKAAYRDQIAQQDLEIKGARDEADLAQIFEREERQIQRLEAQEDYAKKLQMDKTYGKNTTLIQNIEFFESRIGKLPKEKLEKILEEAVGGGDVEDMELIGAINAMPEGSRKSLRESLGLGDSDAPIGTTELEAFKNSPMYEIGQYAGPEIGVDDAGATGGRVRYQEGGDVEMQGSEGVPMVMTYDQLRAKLPEFITDDIVKLIAHSAEAFKDFASIETQQDVESFNDKYDVNLVLPNMDQIDYSMPSGNVDEASTGNVSVPPAVAASPQMPMQTGTGALTPTETALLDPTEQAIRMRNR